MTTPVNPNQDRLPKISVLLAAHNGEKWIEQQIQSILAQQSVEIRLVISLDVSTDNTQALLAQLIENEPRISLLAVGEQFGDGAKNFYRLIKDSPATDADYVAFADQDDIWLPNKLSRAVHKLKHDNAAAYSSNVLAFWENGTELLVCKDQPQTEYDFLFESAGPGCTYVLTHATYTAFRNFLLNNWDDVQSIEFHDWLMYAYCRACKLRWSIDRASGMLYRQHDDNQMGANAGLNAAISRFKRLHSGQYRNEVVRIARLISPLLPGDRVISSLLSNKPPIRPTLISKFNQLRRRRSHRYLLLGMIVMGFF